MEIWVLLAVQFAATITGFALVWRKLESNGAELARVRRLLETLELARFSGVAARRAPAQAEPAFASPAVTSLHGAPAPELRAPAPAQTPPYGRSWPPNTAPAPTPFPRRHVSRQLMANDEIDDVASWRASVSPETGRIIAAAFAAAAPALGFAFNAPAAAPIAAGLCIAAAIMVIALRPLWRAAAWISVLSAGTWSVAAFAIGAAQTAPIVFSLGATLVGACALVFARIGRAKPGAAAALLMGVATLALGTQIGLVGPAGAGFGVIVALAAAIGASSLRIEGFHVAAFAAAGIGLYTLSGQPDAAIWFTPVAAWAGAVFFAISAVRTPVLGAKGVVLATTGAIAPLVAAGALFASHQGLANPFAAAAVFVALAVMFAGVLSVSAQRRGRGIHALNFTAWALSAASIASLSAAIFLASPLPSAAALMTCISVGLVSLNRILPAAIWRAFAVLCTLVAGAAAWLSISYAWPPLALTAVAGAAPSILAACAARIAQRNAPKTAAFFEAAALVGGVATLIALIRFAITGGHPSAPLGFVEAGFHIALWLAAALALAERSKLGARSIRRAGAFVLSGAALAVSVIAAALWLTPWWSARAPSGLELALFQHAPLGFALPAALAWAHWVIWRARNAQLRTRIALGGAALLTAAFATLEVVGARAPDAAGALDWVSIGSGVLAFALAVGINFAPGVTATGAGQLNLEEYLKRDRRRQQRG